MDLRIGKSLRIQEANQLIIGSSEVSEVENGFELIQRGRFNSSPHLRYHKHLNSDCGAE
jgi:hypothetical protein